MALKDLLEGRRAKKSLLEDDASALPISKELDDLLGNIDDSGQFESSLQNVNLQALTNQGHGPLATMIHNFVTFNESIWVSLEAYTKAQGAEDDEEVAAEDDEEDAEEGAEDDEEDAEDDEEGAEDEEVSDGV
mgnify:CR=1 FL=1